MVMPFTTPDPSRSIWTVDDLERLPDEGGRYEVLHGELLMTPLPAVPHQRVAMRLARLIANWCEANAGWECLAPGGVFISETTWLEPDVAVYPVADGAPIVDWRRLPPPALVIEILSPSTTRTDRHRKRPAYLAHGVGVVWLLDVDTRSMERWTAASEFPEPAHEALTWTPGGDAAPLVIESDAIFGSVEPDTRP